MKKINPVEVIKIILLVAVAIVVISLVQKILDVMAHPGAAASGFISWFQRELNNMLSACKPSCKDSSGNDACGGFPPVLNPTCLFGLGILEYLLGFLGISLVSILRAIPAFGRWFSKLGWVNDSVQWLKTKLGLTNEQITDQIDEATKKITDLSLDKIKEAQDKLKESPSL